MTQSLDCEALSRQLSQNRVLLFNRQQEAKKLSDQLSAAKKALYAAQQDVDFYLKRGVLDWLPARKRERLAQLGAAQQRLETACLQRERFESAAAENRLARQRLENEIARASDAIKSVQGTPQPPALSPAQRQEHLSRLKDAVREVRQASQYTAQALSNSQSARTLGTLDVFLDTGLIGDLIKYNRVEDAQQAAALAQSSLVRAKKALDVLPEAERVYFRSLGEISGGLRTWDIVFDDLISGLMVREKIRENCAVLERQLGELNALRRVLERRIDALSKDG